MAYQNKRPDSPKGQTFKALQSGGPRAARAKAAELGVASKVERWLREWGGESRVDQATAIDKAYADRHRVKLVERVERVKPTGAKFKPYRVEVTPKEGIMHDRDIMYGDYYYILDGVLSKPGFVGSVKEFKIANPRVQNVRTCDMVARGLRPRIQRH